MLRRLLFLGTFVAFFGIISLSAAQSQYASYVRVALVEHDYRLERLRNGEGVLWVFGRVQNNYSHQVWVTLDVTVRNPRGKLLSTYHVHVGPIPPHSIGSYNTVGTRTNLLPDDVVGTVTVEPLIVRRFDG